MEGNEKKDWQTLGTIPQHKRLQTAETEKCTVLYQASLIILGLLQATEYAWHLLLSL